MRCQHTNLEELLTRKQLRRSDHVAQFSQVLLQAPRHGRHLVQLHMTLSRENGGVILSRSQLPANHAMLLDLCSMVLQPKWGMSDRPVIQKTRKLSYVRPRAECWILNHACGGRVPS